MGHGVSEAMTPVEGIIKERGAEGWSMGSEAMTPVEGIIKGSTHGQCTHAMQAALTPDACQKAFNAAAKPCCDTVEAHWVQVCRHEGHDSTRKHHLGTNDPAP